MAFVQFSNLSLAFGERDILKNASINLQNGTKAALAGANGCGKSSLMKILCGIQRGDSGDVSKSAGATVSYLPQWGIVHRGKTLYDEMESVFAAFIQAEKDLATIAEELRHADEDRQKNLLQEYNSIQEKLENPDFQSRSRRIDEILTGLGFRREDFAKNCETFSGGWQMRIALGKTLLENCDIILLDEPTNYLDLEARLWLKNFLTAFSGGFLIVSHDRYFLDQTVDEIYELFLGNLTRYKGNYSKYEKVRAVELESLCQKYKTQQAEIEKIEDFIRKFRYKPTKAAQVQERIKMLDKMVKIEIPENLKRVHFSFPPAPHSGEIVLTAKGIQKSYGEKTVLQSLDLQLTRGMRLNVAGKNGAGKTTLLRILAGNDGDFSGEIKIGSGVSIGFFSQENVETMDGEATCLEIIEDAAPLEMQPKVRSLLGAFLFRGDDVFKAVKVLSGGEKSRLAILQLLLRPHNLLILDEPTNHLDISAQEVLKEALSDFGGTVIFVSHDRDFSAAIANGVLDLNGDFPVMYPGDYEYFLSQTEGGEEEPLVNASSPPRQKQQQRLSWEETKRVKAERRSLERREEQLLDQIGKEEDKLAALREKQNLPEIYGDLEKARQIHGEIEKTENNINSLQEEWERVSLKLENFPE